MPGKSCATAIAVSVALLGGCATPGGGETSATEQGAVSGAVIGGLIGYAKGGDLKHTVVGAAAGAAVGAIIGNYIDHKRTKDSKQVYAQYGKKEKVVMTGVDLSKPVLKAGQQGQAAVSYDVVGPDPSASQTITHTVEYYHGKNRVAANSQTMSVTPGGYRTVFPVSVPSGAEEGEYVLVAKVASPHTADEKKRNFRVIYARNDRGELYVASVSPAQ